MPRTGLELCRYYIQGLCSAGRDACGADEPDSGDPPSAANPSPARPRTQPAAAGAARPEGLRSVLPPLPIKRCLEPRLGLSAAFLRAAGRGATSGQPGGAVPAPSPPAPLLPRRRSGRGSASCGSLPRSVPGAAGHGRPRAPACGGAAAQGRRGQGGGAGGRAGGGRRRRGAGRDPGGAAVGADGDVPRERPLGGRRHLRAVADGSAEGVQVLQGSSVDRDHLLHDSSASCRVRNRKAADGAAAAAAAATDPPRTQHRAVWGHAGGPASTVWKNLTRRSCVGFVSCGKTLRLCCIELLICWARAFFCLFVFIFGYNFGTLTCSQRVGGEFPRLDLMMAPACIFPL